MRAVVLGTLLFALLGSISMPGPVAAKHKHDHTDGSADPGLLGVWTLLVEAGPAGSR